MTYQTYAQQPVSQKTTLVTIEGKEKIINFTQSGTTYTKVLDHFVVGLTIDGTGTTFTYTSSTKTLSFDFTGTITSANIIVTYQFYFADRPVILHRNIIDDTSDAVEWESRIERVPAFNTQLSFGKNNKTIVGNGNLVLDNSDRYFNELFKTIRFDNKQFVAYSYDINQTDNSFQKIYEGVLNNASLRNEQVTFSIKDSIFNLNQEVPFMEQFTSEEVIERHTSRFKKRILGFVNGMSVQSVSQLGDGYSLTGTITGISGSNQINGTGTTFLSELAPRDKIIIGSTELTVRKIISNNFLLVAETLTGTVSTSSALVRPSKPWYNTNRTYSICSRPIHRSETTITDLNDRKRLFVASTTGFEPNNKVVISNETYVIDRVTVISNTPVLELDRTLSPNNLPSVGDTVTEQEVQQVKLYNEPILDSDFSVTNPGFNVINSTDECFLNLSNTAEMNIAPEGTFGNDVTAVANSNFIILGTPTIQNIEIAQDGTWRGTHLRLARQNDTSEVSGTVCLVW